MRNQSKNKPAAPKPLSLRLNHEQKEILDKEADGLPVSTYIKLQLFGRLKNAKDTRIRRPIKDKQVLGQLLGKFGQSNIAPNLNVIADAARADSFVGDPDTLSVILQACQDVKEMRDLLVRALGPRD